VCNVILQQTLQMPELMKISPFYPDLLLAFNPDLQIRATF
jgi:hypothetical protein